MENPPINKHLSILTGQICHTTWMANWSKGKKKYSPQHFMPDYTRPRTQAEKASRATEEMKIIFGALAKNGRK